jgi:hypothetical protein
MNDVSISVIIPTHNRPQQLPRTLAALYEQDLATEDYEIIVVDDGSDPQVQLPSAPVAIRQKLLRLEGVERSAARNAGAAAASGDVLVFIDDDIIVNRNFLSGHWQAQTDWPGALVTGSIRLPPEELQRPFVRFRQHLEDQGLPAQRGIQSCPNFCAAGNLSISREVFRKLGGFDAGLSSSEDQDLALRHCARGGSVAYLPEAEGIHHDRALDIRSYCSRVQWGTEWMVLFCLRYPDLADNAARAAVNGPFSLTCSDYCQNLKKLLKSVLAFPPLTAVVFGACRLAERLLPRTVVPYRFYRLLLGIHIQRGYRRGLRRFAQVAPNTLAPTQSVLTETSVG